MKAFIQLKENEPNNWTAIVTGDNKTANHYNEKKVKLKGSRDRAIAHALKHSILTKRMD